MDRQTNRGSDQWMDENTLLQRYASENDVYPTDFAIFMKAVWTDGLTDGPTNELM